MQTKLVSGTVLIILSAVAGMHLSLTQGTHSPTFASAPPLLSLILPSLMLPSLTSLILEGASIACQHCHIFRKVHVRCVTSVQIGLLHPQGLQVFICGDMPHCLCSASRHTHLQSQIVPGCACAFAATFDLIWGGVTRCDAFNLI